MTELDHARIIRHWSVDCFTTHFHKVSLSGRECTHGECHVIFIRGVGFKACEDLTCAKGGVEAVHGHGGRVGGGAGRKKLLKMLPGKYDMKNFSRTLVHFIQLLPRYCYFHI
jgi:hypothetical protein